jgi:hypothetical protein
MMPALRFVRFELSEKLKDPAFRYQMANPKSLTEENTLARIYISRVANYYEGMGALVKSGLSEKNLVLDGSSTTLALVMWKQLSPAIVLACQSLGDPSLYENFEYLVVLAEDWKAAHLNGAYSAGVTLNAPLPTGAVTLLFNRYRAVQSLFREALQRTRDEAWLQRHGFAGIQSLKMG